MATSNSLASRLSTAAFAFRGYNTTNLGRTPELLAHPAYGATVERYLDDASATASDIMGRRIDLAARVRRREAWRAPEPLLPARAGLPAIPPTRVAGKLR